MSFFSRNIGTLDRAVRIGTGVLLIALAAMESIGVWGYLGVIPLVTGVFGNCPAYSLLGIRTCAPRTR
ncbi:DUF2892 domain-containing protein [Variovorax sp. EBFNA2]|uniref:YgaP family membrane protein n=1 Tax=Variovorax sp. EBFNA2 TaxID=3342097 RepID=UPI0029C0625D|nr:DUF2892 domain-containing protein [Variovorax boronicumulans]WPG41352.1 DUF2892 domain-containing protein [Variovorax boronicumulans]